MKNQNLIENRRIRRYKNFILATLMFGNIIPIIFGLIFILTFSGNIPVEDQWHTDIPLGIKFFDGKGELLDLLTIHNDHRPIIPFSVMIPIYLLTSFNMIITILLGYFLYILSFLILALIIKRKIHDFRNTLLILFPVSLFYFNFYILGSLLWVTVTLYNSIMLLSALLMLYCIDKSENHDRWFFIAIVAAFCCMFSFSGGTPIWFGGIIAILLKKGKNYIKKMIIWIISAFFFIYLQYFYLGITQSLPTYEVHTATAYRQYILIALTHPIQKFLCFCGTLGSNIIHDASYAMFFGIALLIIFTLLVYFNINKLDLKNTAAFYGMTLYGLIVSLMLTLSRSGNDGVFGPSDNIYFISAIRHFPSIILFLVGLYCLVAYYYVNDIKKHSKHLQIEQRKQEIKNKLSPHFIGVCIITIFLLLSFSFHINPGVNWGKNWFMGQNEDAIILSDINNTSDYEIETILKDANQVRKIALYFQGNNLNFYDINQTLHVNNQFLTELRRIIFNQTVNHQINLNSEINEGILSWCIDEISINSLGFIQVTGWAYNPKNKDPNYSVFISFTDKLNQILLYKTELVKRPDVTEAYKNLDLKLDNSGFLTIINIFDLNNQPYRMGIIVKSQNDAVLSNTNFIINNSRIDVE